MTPAAIKAARQALGLTVGGFALLLEVHPRSIRRWERGDRRLPADVATRIATAVRQARRNFD